MTEGKDSEKKITVDEAMRRFRPLFLMLMLIPLMGMVAAMIIIYILEPKNMLWIEALLLVSIAVFLWTTYRFARQMGNMTKGTPPKPASSEFLTIF